VAGVRRWRGSTSGVALMRSVSRRDRRPCYTLALTCAKSHVIILVVF